MNAELQQLQTIATDIDAALTAKDQQIAAAATQAIAAAGTIATLNAQLATIAAKPSPSTLPSVRSLFPNLPSSRMIGHLETWWDGGTAHGLNASRIPKYNQLNPVDVANHCAHIKAMGFDAVMPNMYPVGSKANACLLVYLPALVKAGLGIMPNIDKGIYEGTPSPQAAIQAYITWLRANVFNLGNAEKWNGKFVVTYFVLPTDDPKVFAAIEAANQDIVFVYNSANAGANQMAWVQSDLDANTAWWLKTYAGRAGTLDIPCVSPGFDDTVVRSGVATSIWSDGSPARVWPAGKGPNPGTLQAMVAAINAYYTPANQPPWIQFVTLNDWDEGTAMEGTIGWIGNFLAPTA